MNESVNLEKLDKLISDARENLVFLEKLRKIMCEEKQHVNDMGRLVKCPRFEALLDYTNSGAKNIRSKSRKMEYAYERHFVCWIAKYELGMHEKTIATMLGDRCRTTIISSIQQAENMMQFPSYVKSHYRKLYLRALAVKEAQEKKSK